MQHSKTDSDLSECSVLLKLVVIIYFLVFVRLPEKFRTRVWPGGRIVRKFKDHLMGIENFFKPIARIRDQQTFDWFLLMIYLRSDVQMTSLSYFFVSLLCKTDRFHVAVRLFSNRSQKTSKCGKNCSDTLASRLVTHFFFLTTFWRRLWSITRELKQQRRWRQGRRLVKNEFIFYLGISRLSRSVQYAYVRLQKRAQAKYVMTA